MRLIHTSNSNPSYWNVPTWKKRCQIKHRIIPTGARLGTWTNLAQHHLKKLRLIELERICWAKIDRHVFLFRHNCAGYFFCLLGNKKWQTREWREKFFTSWMSWHDTKTLMLSCNRRRNEKSWQTARGKSAVHQGNKQTRQSMNDMSLPSIIGRNQKVFGFSSDDGVFFLLINCSFLQSVLCGAYEISARIRSFVELGVEQERYREEEVSTRNFRTRSYTKLFTVNFGFVFSKNVRIELQFWTSSPQVCRSSNALLELVLLLQFGTIVDPAIFVNGQLWHYDSKKNGNKKIILNWRVPTNEIENSVFVDLWCSFEMNFMIYFRFEFGEERDLKIEICVRRKDEPRWIFYWVKFDSI